MCDWQLAKLVKSQAVTQTFFISDFSVLWTELQPSFSRCYRRSAIKQHKVFVIVLANSGRLLLLSVMCRSSSLLVGKTMAFCRGFFFLIIIVIVVIPTIPVGQN